MGRPLQLCFRQRVPVGTLLPIHIRRSFLQGGSSHVICNIVSLERDRPARWKPTWRDWLDSECHSVSRPHSHGPASLGYSFYHRCRPVPRLGSAAFDGSPRTLPPPGHARRGTGLRWLRAALSGPATGGRGVWYRSGHHLSVPGTVGSQVAPIRRNRTGFRVFAVDSWAASAPDRREHPAWNCHQACPRLPPLDRDSPHHLRNSVPPLDSSHPFSFR